MFTLKFRIFAFWKNPTIWKNPVKTQGFLGFSGFFKDFGFFANPDSLFISIWYYTFPLFQDGQVSKQEMVDKYDLYVGSQATDFGEALKKHEELWAPIRILHLVMLSIQPPIRLQVLKDTGTI